MNEEKKFKTLKSVPRCCYREIDLIAVEKKTLYFQCKNCGEVVLFEITKEDLK